MNNVKNRVVTPEALRTRFVHIALMITYVLCAIFAVVYLLLKAYVAFGLILIVSLLYSLSVLLIKRRHGFIARVWYLSVLIIHITAITALFSSSSGFHYYYFVVPALSGVLFDVSRKWQRVSASLYFLAATSLFLFFNYYQPNSFIEVSVQWFRVLHISSSVIAMIALFIGFSVLAVEIRKSRTDLIQLATTDSLTGIANRREFIMRGAQEISRCKRYDGSLSLLLIDLDYFKRVNDTYGHAVGDMVLTRFVEIVKKQIRLVDFFGRLGGEEFGILTPESAEVPAYSFGERLRSSVQDMLVSVDGSDIRVTASIGISSFRPGCDSFEALLSNADKALYRAKDNGRNRTEMEAV